MLGKNHSIKEMKQLMLVKNLSIEAIKCIMLNKIEVMKHLMLDNSDLSDSEPI
jgi:hypothetical protein